MAFKRNSPQPVDEGGTGSITLTDHGVLVGGGTAKIDAIAVGATGTVLQGSTGADPAFTATPTVTSISFGGSALSTFTNWTAWTPTVIGETAAGSTSYTVQSGRYSRIGNMVTAQFSIAVSSATGTGNTLIASLPLTINSSAASPVGPVIVTGPTYPAGTTYVNVFGVLNTTTLRLLAGGSALSPASRYVQMIAGGVNINGSITYEV